MLTLTIAHGSGRVETGSGAPFRVWRDEVGAPCAFGYHTSSGMVMEWPGVGRYLLPSEGETVVATPDQSAHATTVEDIFERFVHPFALLERGFEALHASAVLAPGGVVAFCAESGGGKSTVAFGLSRLGLPQWADDTLMFQSQAGRVRSRSLPFKPRLHRDASARLSKLGASPDAPACHAGQWADVAGVYILRRRPMAANLETERLGPAAALTALLPHARALDPENTGRKQLMLSRYLDLLAAVPVFAATVPGDLSLMPFALAELQELFHGGAATARAGAAG